MLGAAIGDALGWPHEMRPRRKGIGHADGLEYKTWIKRGGGQYQPFEERIDAGSYSDDTQLILAVARALGREDGRWWEQLAYQELPFWTLYERGGGGATKRAATSWMNGAAPWRAKPDDTRRYFEAGGNGVAMRILPHCIAHAGDAQFDGIARNVMADGVLTHGHPRALVGALVYAFALWTALRHRGTLGFGQLVSAAIGSVSVWGPPPPIDEFWPDWREGTDARDYHRIWDEAVHEQVELLQLAKDGIDAGAASFDEEVLERLGCFDKKVNGSGTVTAAAALYLASRHAADPTEGLRIAALAHGADTDTLASMTCALLGAAIGGEWLAGYFKPLQDRETLVTVARTLVHSGDGRAGSLEPVSRNEMARFKTRLQEQASGTIRLPIGLDAYLEPWDGLKSKGRSTRAQSWVARAENGQTFFFKSFSRETKPAGDLLKSVEEEAETTIALRLAVKDLRISRLFYEEGLGLKVSRERDRSVWFGRALGITTTDADQVNPGSTLLFIQVSNIDARFDRLSRGGANMQSEITARADRRQFRCTDPDGYQLELYEKLG